MQNDPIINKCFRYVYDFEIYISNKARMVVMFKNEVFNWTDYLQKAHTTVNRLSSEDQGAK